MNPDQDQITSALAAGAVIRRSSNWPSGAVGDETVIMNIGTGDYVGLSKTGGRIWQLLNEQQTLAQLCEKLQDTYDASVKEIADDVSPFIVELVQKGVVLMDAPDS